MECPLLLPDFVFQQLVRASIELLRKKASEQREKKEPLFSNSFWEAVFLVFLTLLKIMRGLTGWTCMLRAAQMFSIYIFNNFTLIAFFTLKLPQSIIERNHISKKLILNCHKINRREDNETEAMNYQVGSAKPHGI